MRRNYKEKFNKLHNCHVNCKKPDTNDCVLYPMIREFKVGQTHAEKYLPSRSPDNMSELLTWSEDSSLELNYAISAMLGRENL